MDIENYTSSSSKIEALLKIKQDVQIAIYRQSAICGFDPDTFSHEEYIRIHAPNIGPPNDNTALLFVYCKRLVTLNQKIEGLTNA